MDKDVEKGLFRKDLFHRLSVFAIRIPPLRERPEELPSIIRNLLSKITTEMKLDTNPDLDPQATKKIQAHNWPGNIRELRNVLERAIIQAQNHIIAPEHISFGIEADTGGANSAVRPSQSETSIKRKYPEPGKLISGIRTQKPAHDEIRSLFAQFILEKGWSRAQLARSIGVDSSTLKKWLKEAGLPAGTGGRPKKKRAE